MRAERERKKWRKRGEREKEREREREGGEREREREQGERKEERRKIERGERWREKGIKRMRDGVRKGGKERERPLDEDGSQDRRIFYVNLDLRDLIDNFLILLHLD